MYDRDIFDREGYKLSVFTAFRILYLNYLTACDAPAHPNPDADRKKEVQGKIRYCCRNCPEVRQMMPPGFASGMGCPDFLPRYRSVLISFYSEYLYYYRDEVEPLLPELDKAFVKAARPKALRRAARRKYLNVAVKIAAAIAVMLGVYAGLFVMGYHDKKKDAKATDVAYVSDGKVHYYGQYSSAVYDIAADSVCCRIRPAGYLDYSYPMLLLASVSKISPVPYFKDWDAAKTKNLLNNGGSLIENASKMRGKYKILMPLYVLCGYLGYKQGETYAINRLAYESEVAKLDSISSTEYWKRQIPELERRTRLFHSIKD